MADTLDIITVAELESALNFDASDPATTAEKEHVITAASRVVDQVFGPVVKRTVTGELHDGGDWRIALRQTPILSITSVTEYRSTTGTALTAETNVSKPGSGYLLVTDGHNTHLLRRSGGWDYPFAAGRSNVAVTYVAGRYENTASVDARFKQACAQVAIHLWQARGGGPGVTVGEGAPFGGIPFSMGTLKKRLRDMLPDDALPPGSG